MEYYQRSLRIYEEIGNKHGIALVIGNMAIVYDAQSDYKSALEYDFKALKIDEEIKDKEGIARISANIALTYDDQGDYPKALEYDFKALTLNEEAGSKINLAINLNNIGYVYNEEGDYPKALLYYFKALKINEEIGSNEQIARVSRNIGKVYFNQNYDSLSFNYCLKALKIDEGIGYKAGIAKDMGYIGDIYYRQKDYPKALESYQGSLQLNKEVGYKYEVAAQLKNLGRVYVSIVKDKPRAYRTTSLLKANNYLQEAIVIGKEIHASYVIQEAYENLAEVYRLNGNYKKALEYTDSYIAVRDSLFSNQNNKKVVQMGMEYDYNITHVTDSLKIAEKEKIKGIELHRQRTYMYMGIAGIFLLSAFSGISIYNYNRRKKLTFQKKVSETEMTALRSQMNPHFIFNALNSIHTYIQDNNNKIASSYLLKFSQLTRIILENSMHQFIPLAEELYALELYLSLEQLRLEGRLAYEINVAADVDKDNTLIPPLILQPFIENAILHGLQYKEAGGHITVQICRRESSLHCTITDNGIGRKKAGEMKQGVYAAKKESLGMKLTQQRIAIINQTRKSNAHVSITDVLENGESAGVKVELVLPLELRF